MSGAEILSARSRRARIVVLICHALLLLLISVDVAGIEQLELGSRAFLWGVWAGPLLVFLPGLIRAAWKSYLWLCFVLLMYFMVVVDRLFQKGASLGAGCELLLICAAFVAAMLYARWRQRELASIES